VGAGGAAMMGAVHAQSARSHSKSADFMAWTRGRYFFYAKASSPPALDSFMRQFPF
jgi:hypothetical protein